MNSSMFDSTNTFGSEWDTAQDTSEFLYDSPQPHHQDLFAAPDQGGNPPLQQSPAAKPTVVKQEPLDDNSRPHLSVPHSSTSQPSSNSASDSTASSSESPAHLKQSSSVSPSLPTFPTNPVPSNDFPSSAAFDKMDGMFADDDHTINFGNPTFPSVNSDMDHLSLSNTGGFEFGAAPTPSMGGIFPMERDNAMTPRNFNSAIKNSHSLNTSPQQMTVSPQKMFSLGSREESPNDINMNSGQSSPFPLNSHSPIGGNMSGFGADFSSDTIAGKMGNFAGKDPIQSITVPSDMNTALSPAALKQPTPTDKWPCRLTVDPTPEKSRVETQIPIKLTLYNPPPGYTRLHLPGYTISKPKFQHKPAFEGDDETLELSVLLVCASAMQQKEGALKRAFVRAEADEVPIRKDDTPSSSTQEDNDPDRPLNGGPVAICPGCVIRERKRANRKKNKKLEEEEEWQKDENKRVIVFNCQEIKEWCVSGTKEATVKDQGGAPVESMFVNAPMRIACYCRHQSEKVGFQVIFTIRKPNGEVIAQGISQSIMITDDHKQPPPSNMPGMSMANQTQPSSAAMFQQSPQFAMYTQNFGHHSPHDLPFRPSFSVPNLSQMAHQFAQQQQQHPNGFPRQFSSNNLSQQDASASATPRTLSRPASPTNPAGQPGSKKRRSGGPGHNKMPSGLSMTRIDTKRSPPPSTGPLTANSTNFNFASSGASSFATTPLDGAFPTPHHMRNASASQFQGGPPFAPGSLNPGDADMSQFYSAPTSQHQSRAPSPSSAGRFPQQQNFGTQVNPSQSQLAAMQNSIPSQAAAALSNLPAGLNLNKPPIIQRLIPNSGSRGDEVTVLGSGFFQGLDVMFGDAIATNTTFWGDTTLVCRAPAQPPGMRGPLNVVFRHQHPHHSNNVENIPALMPTRLVQFCHYPADEPFEAGGGGAPSMFGQPFAVGPGAGSPLGSSSPGLDDGSSLGGIGGMARNFFAQQASPSSQTPSAPSSSSSASASASARQALGSGSAGFNAASAARRMGLNRSISGDAGAFRKAG